MATNIKSGSIGNIKVQSGDGLPSHTDVYDGTLFHDRTNGKHYQIINGIWRELTSMAYGQIYRVDTDPADNTTTYNSWFKVSQYYAQSQGFASGMEVVGNALKVKPGHAGTYELYAYITAMREDSSRGEFRLGIGKNGSTSPSGEWYRGSVNVFSYDQYRTIAFKIFLALSDNDTVELLSYFGYRMKINHTMLFARKISN